VFCTAARTRIAQVVDALEEGLLQARCSPRDTEPILILRQSCGDLQTLPLHVTRKLALGPCRTKMLRPSLRTWIDTLRTAFRAQVQVTSVY
jgi:hypothetical protein